MTLVVIVIIFMQIRYYIYFFIYCLDAIEKPKLMYILKEDTKACLAISSPLETFKNNTLVYHTVNVNVRFKNLIFAYLEINYEINLNNFCITLF